MNLYTRIKNTNLYAKINSEQYKLFRQIIIYAFFGGFGAIIDIVGFKIFSTQFHIYYLVANVMSALCGLVVSFLLNTYFNFKAKTEKLKRFITFITIGMSGIVVSTIVLWTLSFIIKDKLISKVISSFIVAAYQFVLNKLITYRDK